MPTKDHTIDRIDPSGNYEPNNVRWVHKLDQPKNRSSNLYVTYNGKRITLAELVRITGLGRDALMRRIFRLNMSPEEAIKDLCNIQK